VDLVVSSGPAPDLVPTANPDTSIATINGPVVTGNVLANDSPGDVPTTVTLVEQNGASIPLGSPVTTVAGATLTINTDGDYSYVPPATTATETFTYTITDNDLDESSSTLEISTDTVDLQFVDESVALGSLGDLKTWAISWADVDNDGYTDIFLNNHDLQPVLLNNIGGTSFLDIASSSPDISRSDKHSCVWADFDQDGDQDLYCNTGALSGTGSDSASLYRNEGNGIFADIAEQTGTENGPGRGRTVNWADFDLDGDLDLFVANWRSSDASIGSILFDNSGGQFLDVTAARGLDTPAAGLRQTIVFDYERDGDPDLLVHYDGYDPTRHLCDCIAIMRNDGQGSFTQLDSTVTGLPNLWPRFIAHGDYDNDGDMDFFVGNNTPSTREVYRNNGNGTFTGVSLDSIGLQSLLGSERIEHAAWADLNNDGYLDLYVVRNTDANTNAPNALFVNRGNGTFEEVAESAGAAGPSAGVGQSAGMADYDKNGFLDLLIGNGLLSARGPYQLLRNTGNLNNWIRIELDRGSPGVTVGSKIFVTTGTSTQYREYGHWYSAFAFHEQIAHFGLGASATVDRIRVEWPDGTVSEWLNLPVNQEIRLALVAVPEVTGLSQAAAETAIVSAGFVVGTVTNVDSDTVSDTVPAGNVVSQAPLGGSLVASGSAVDLVVSSGPALVAVPEVTGLSQAAAETAIVSAGFVVGTVTNVDSDTVATQCRRATWCRRRRWVAVWWRRAVRWTWWSRVVRLLSRLQK
jgi:hypothetical protein